MAQNSSIEWTDATRNPSEVARRSAPVARIAMLRDLQNAFAE